jgi:3-oxoacyl-[acyl-carrier protein] reductase
MTPKLEGKVALITGSGRGIGRAIALKLASEGARIVVNDLDAAPAQDVVDEIRKAGGHAVACVGSVSAPDFAERFVGTAVSEFKGLDIIVNNAGYTWDNVVQKMTDEQWYAMIDVHLTAPFRILRAAQPVIRALSKQEKEAGQTVVRKVVNISSVAGLFGNAGQTNYSTAKAGITALTLTAAKALGRFGVRANAICPRARTAMTADVFGEAPSLEQGQIDPLSPEHVVSLVRFLASPAAADVNGQVFIVYGPIVTLVAAPTAEHRFHADGDVWDPDALSAAMQDYFTDRDPESNFGVIGLMGD